MNDSTLPPDLADRLVALFRGTADETDDGARLFARLAAIARNATRGFQSLDEATRDDCVQDALLGVLHYLRRDQDFAGDITRLCVAIARNRCRDVRRKWGRRPEIPIDPMTEWLADPSRSPLDLIEEQQRRALLQAGLDNLDEACRRLLRRLYVQGDTPEAIRQEEGLGSVQAVYYRRDACLRRARKNLKRVLAGALKPMSAAGTDMDPSPQG